MTSGIYTISQVNNTLVYVGSSTNVERRWTTHKRELRNRCHHNARLQEAWLRIGEDAFLFSIVEVVDDPEDFPEREQGWITFYDATGYSSGYNSIKAKKFSTWKKRIWPKRPATTPRTNKGMK